MAKLLFISPTAVHNNISHAGGKTVNYYLKRFDLDEDFEVAFAYTGSDSDDFKSMKKQYPYLKIITAFKKKILLAKIFDRIRFKAVYPILKKIYPRYYITNNYSQALLSLCLQNTQRANFYPDIIIAEFTGTIFGINSIKRAFPNSLTVASAHDITYQSVKRYLQTTKKNGLFADLYYENFKKNELKCLNAFDVVVTLNKKDSDILKNEPNYTTKKTVSLAPYYDTYNLSPGVKQSSIVYFGAMRRIENSNAVNWFLSNVWPIINRKYGGEINFVIVGGGLTAGLKQRFLTFPNVSVAGFVANPVPIFNDAFCFIVPLQLGAGIKVKVLDAMSSGIPVVTNHVGIEGIPASPGIDYMHCVTIDDYVTSISKLKDNKVFRNSLSKNAQEIVKTNFDLEKNYVKYKEMLIGRNQ